MNVIISNQQDNIIKELNIEIAKAIQGEFKIDDIINSFSNFFFSRMILDITAIKDYENILNYQKLSIGLPVDKIILVIPSNTIVATNNYLSKLISMGYYNFTTNLEGIEYLLENPNSYKDVAHLHQILDVEPQNNNNNNNNNNKNSLNNYILGIKNITQGAGATTLSYLIYKELNDNYGINTLAIEVNKRDFAYFNDKKLLSVTGQALGTILLKSKEYNVIIVDLNDLEGDLCDDVIYLIEPSIIKMNKLIKRDLMIFTKLRGKKVVLNKTFISNNDIKDFENETELKIYYQLPAFNDRVRQASILELLSKLGLINYNAKNKE